MTTSPRRWFQFTLRGLLILMLLVATYFAGFVTSQKLAEKERRQAEERATAELAAAKVAAERDFLVQSFAGARHTVTVKVPIESRYLGPQEQTDAGRTLRQLLD